MEDVLSFLLSENKPKKKGKEHILKEKAEIRQQKSGHKRNAFANADTGLFSLRREMAQRPDVFPLQGLGTEHFAALNGNRFRQPVAGREFLDGDLLQAAALLDGCHKRHEIEKYQNKKSKGPGQREVHADEKQGQYCRPGKEMPVLIGMQLLAKSGQKDRSSFDGQDTQPAQAVDSAGKEQGEKEKQQGKALHAERQRNADNCPQADEQLAIAAAPLMQAVEEKCNQEHGSEAENSRKKNLPAESDRENGTDA